MSGVTAGSAALMFLLICPQHAVGFFFASLLITIHKCLRGLCIDPALVRYFSGVWTNYKLIQHSRGGVPARLTAAATPKSKQTLHSARPVNCHTTRQGHPAGKLGTWKIHPLTLPLPIPVVKPAAFALARSGLVRITPLSCKA